MSSSYNIYPEKTPLTYSVYDKIESPSYSQAPAAATGYPQSVYQSNEYYIKENRDEQDATFWLCISLGALVFTFCFGFMFFALFPLLYTYAKFKNSPSQRARTISSVSGIIGALIIALYLFVLLVLLVSFTMGMTIDD